MKVVIRPETAADFPSIRAVNLAAFGQEGEGKLVDALRAGGHVTLSLVAEHAGQIVGHILFSPLALVNEGSTTPALALAPMAVLPAQQRQGIGSALVQQGLAICRAQGHRIVVVLGHRNYYPRFGFSADKARPLRSPYAGEHFMALELVPGALQDVVADVRYAPPFNEL